MDPNLHVKVGSWLNPKSFSPSGWSISWLVGVRSRGLTIRGCGFDYFFLSRSHCGILCLPYSFFTRKVVSVCRSSESPPNLKVESYWLGRWLTFSTLAPTPNPEVTCQFPVMGVVSRRCHFPSSKTFKVGYLQVDTYFYTFFIVWKFLDLKFMTTLWLWHQDYEA